MYSFIVFVSCIFAYISFSDATCFSNQTHGNAAVFSVHQRSASDDYNKYCINLVIRLQADNDNVMEYHIQDYENVAKSFLLQLNSTIRNRININCASNQNVQTGDNSVAYSYNCCEDTNTNGVQCPDPKLVPIITTTTSTTTTTTTPQLHNPNNLQQAIQQSIK
uniref:Uncharacterized protein n=1 Tax=Panagrolaimus sp. PS1159 TaxID=55785 RepID=A0AC35FM73_9BILA